MMREDISWWSRRTACSHTLLVIHLAYQNMLSGINLQKPHMHCDSPPFFSVYSLAVQLHTLPVSRTFPPPWKNSTTQYSVVSPAAHVMKGLEKYWHSQRQRSVPTNICSLMLRVCACFCARKRYKGGKGFWKWTAWGRSGLGTFPGLLNGIWLFSDSW